MRRPLRILMVAAVVLAGILGIAGAVLYRAYRTTPPFYERALAAKVEVQEQASEAFLQQATALASEVETQDVWSVAFTDEQINGWLAVDVPKNLPQALPPSIQNPRLSIRPGEATVAFRVKTDTLNAVISVVVDVFLSAPNEVAIRFCGASLGSLPIPLAKVIEPVGEAAVQLDLHLTWRQQDGDPVAIVSLDRSPSAVNREMELKAIELADGELRLAGVSRKRTNAKPLAQHGEEAVVQSASARQEKLQR